jgi:colicin import membrane protein
MKRAAPAEAASPQRTIGEILLEHGYVTEEDLAAAVQRQEETGFPLGQILVEAGAITRLELASALAVQWADVAPSRGPLEEPTGRPRIAPRQESDDEVDDAEAPIFSYGSPAGEDDAWRDEIRTAARAFAQRLDAVEQTLDELRGEAGNEPDVDVEAKFSELLGPLARHVDETARRVEAMEAAAEAVAAQSRAAAQSAESIREELSRRAAAATAAIEELAARLDQRPDGAEAAEMAALRAEVAETAELRAEIAEAAALRTEVAHLRAEVTAFAAAPGADQAARDQVADLAARVDALADPTALEDLRRALDSLADRPASDPVLAGRVQELATRLDALAERAASDPGLVARVQELASRLDDVAERPAGDTELTGRVDELSGIVGNLTAVVEELRAGPSAEDDGFEARVDELARRVHVLADAGEAAEATQAKVDALTSQLNDVVDRLSRIQHTPDESAVTALAARIDALEQSSSTNGDAPVAGVDASAMAQLTSQVAEATAGWERDRAALEKRIAELAQRVARAPAAAPGADGATPASADATPPNEHDLNRLWFAVERLSLQLTEHHRTLGMLMGGAGGEGQLEALAARVEILERVGGAPRAAADGSAPTDTGGGAAYGDVAALARRVEEVSLASEANREKILTQIEQMMSSLDWRFQRLESGGQAA